MTVKELREQLIALAPGYDSWTVIGIPPGDIFKFQHLLMDGKAKTISIVTIEKGGVTSN